MCTCQNRESANAFRKGALTSMQPYQCMMCTVHLRTDVDCEVHQDQLFLVELQIRQKLGSIEKDTLLLTVEDPKPNIGSGSATLNALLCVAERLAAKRGLTVRISVVQFYIF